MCLSKSFDSLTVTIPLTVGHKQAVLTNCYVANSVTGNFSLLGWYVCCYETDSCAIGPGLILW
jgi:hypothetical protein